MTTHPRLCQILCTVLALGLSACQSPPPEGNITAEDVKAHLSHQQENYENLVEPGAGSGIGRVIGAPGTHWEQFCLDSGVCVDVATTDAPIRTAGGLGCYKTKRMAYVFRQLAVQMDAAQEPERLVELLSQAADRGTALGGGMMMSVEGCVAEPGCDVGERVKALRNEQLAAFSETRQALETYLAEHPEVMQRFPDARKLIPYQLDQIEKMAQGITATRLNGKWTLSNPADKKYQTAWELCNAVGAKGCKIKRPGYR